MGTEIHLVNRLAKEYPREATMITLDDSGCLCTTMFRISPQHLCWALENLVEGTVVNQIKVDRRQSAGPAWRWTDAGTPVSEESDGRPYVCPLLANVGVVS